MAAQQSHYLMRPVVESEIPSLCELAKTTFVETFGHLYQPRDLEAFLVKVFSETAVASDLRDPAMTYRVVEDRGRLVGYCKVGPIKAPVVPDVTPAFELRQLYVRKSHLGQGIGASLMSWGIGKLVLQGAKRIYISVYSDNTRAIEFYRGFGFEKVGEYKFMVGDHADDEWILARDFHRTSQS